MKKVSNDREKWYGIDHPKHGRILFNGPGAYWLFSVAQNAMQQEAFGGKPVVGWDHDSYIKAKKKLDPEDFNDHH